MVDCNINDKMVIGIGQLKLLISFDALHGPNFKFDMSFYCIFPADFADIFGSDGHLLCTQETLVCGEI